MDPDNRFTGTARKYHDATAPGRIWAPYEISGCMVLIFPNLQFLTASHYFTKLYRVWRTINIPGFIISGKPDTDKYLFDKPTVFG
jgi:hypothetical protein